MTRTPPYSDSTPDEQDGDTSLLRSEWLIATEHAGQRFDRALATLLPEFSRARIQQWIKQGEITLDGLSVAPKHRLRGGEHVRLDLETPVAVRLSPEAIHLDIIHEDDEVLVLDKAAGLVVHPGAGNPSGTLVNALLHHDSRLSAIPRAGVVHRLDKDTTGLMVVAKTLAAHKFLVNALRDRQVSRHYQAIVWGALTGGGSVDAPIGRHSTQRTRMTVSASGKPARTHYRVLHRFPSHTHVGLQLESGRTHQIRVHMAHLGFPLVGDPVYGGRARAPAGAGDALREVLAQFERQALHASQLSFQHPANGEEVRFESPPPADFEALLGALGTA